MRAGARSFVLLWNFKMQFSKRFTLSRFSWAGLRAFLFFLCLVTSSARADLTQAQMTQAILDALANYEDGYGGLYVTPWGDASYPAQDYAISYYLYDTLNGSSHYTVGQSAGLIQQYVARLLAVSFGITNQVDEIASLLSALPSVSVTNQLEGMAYDLTEIQRNLDPDYIGYFANSVVRALYDEDYGTPLLNKIRNLTYTQDSRLRVFDSEANESLAAMLNQLRGMENFANGAASTVTNAIYQAQQANEDYWDQSPSSAIASGERAAQEMVEETNDYVDQLTEDTEPYEPQPEEVEPPDDNPVGSDDDRTRLNDVQSPTHSTLLKFQSASTVNIGQNSGVRWKVPLMEYDLSSDGAADFVSDVGTVCRVFWTAIFSLSGFLLWYRAMLKARQMLLAARVGSVGNGTSLELGAIGDGNNTPPDWY